MSTALQSPASPQKPPALGKLFFLPQDLCLTPDLTTTMQHSKSSLGFSHQEIMSYVSLSANEQNEVLNKSPIFKKNKIDLNENTAFKLIYKVYPYDVWDSTCNAASSRISRSSSNSLPVV